MNNNKQRLLHLIVNSMDRISMRRLFEKTSPRTCRHGYHVNYFPLQLARLLLNDQ